MDKTIGILTVALFVFVLGTPARCADGPARCANFHDAVREGEVASVRALLEKNPDLLDTLDKAGRTPLNVACLEAWSEVAELLLAKGADLNIADSEGNKPIHNAARAGDMDIVEMLAAKGADVNERTPDGDTPVIWAASAKRFVVVEILIDLGAKADVQNKTGWSPLLYATIHGSEYCARVLLENGADPDVANNEGVRPLHSAASFGRRKIAGMLLEHGATVDARNAQGETPLSWALNANSLSTAKIFLEHGADVNSKNDHGGTPLINACHRGTARIVELFVSAGADIHAVDEQGMTPLAAACFSSPEIVDYLIAKGAEVNPARKGARTPLHAAVTHGDHAVVETLVEKGARLDAADERGLTPLHLATRRGKTEAATFLLSRGAGFGSTDNALKRTPLHDAAVNGYAEIVELLVEAGADRSAKDGAGKRALDYAIYHGFKKIAKILAGHDGQALAKAFAKPSLLEKKLKSKEAIVWHLGHAGWAIKTQNHLLLFDYFDPPGEAAPSDPSLASGRINLAELKNQPLTVFSTHGHGDHYDAGMFAWKDEVAHIDYVLGHEPDGVDHDYTFIGPRKTRLVDGMKISTIESNDEGVGFLVEVDGLAIFHAGDHADGRPEASHIYRAEIDRIASLAPDLDIAFLPITGCGLGDREQVKAGARWAIEKLDAALCFPMHAGTATEQYMEFAKETMKQNPAAAIAYALSRGDRFFYSKGKPMADL